MGNANSHQSQKARYAADMAQTKWKKSDDLRWGYGRERGPDTWWVHFPLAAGTHQSPIDINPETAEFDSDLAAYPLKICYHLTEAKTIVNTGHSCQVNIKKPVSYITGGPLPGQKLLLQQFHVHWGDVDGCGSEHLIHRKAFSGELHFVHWNVNQFRSYQEAAAAEDGLAVIAVLLKLSSAPNQYFDYLMSFLPSIPHKGQSAAIAHDFDMNGLLPRDTGKYWTYKGSLTTPPCNETVTWVVFYEPIAITREQLHTLRQLLSYGASEDFPRDEFGGRILKNYRPIQPQGTRKVRTLEHVFMGYGEFHEQFHNQALFTGYSEFKCQFQRQGIKF